MPSLESWNVLPYLILGNSGHKIAVSQDKKTTFKITEVRGLQTTKCFKHYVIYLPQSSRLIQ